MQLLTPDGFVQWGTIRSITVLEDPETLLKDSAIVVYEDPRSAAEAIRQLHLKIKMYNPDEWLQVASWSRL